MARPCTSGPKRFVIRSGEGDPHEITAADPQEAYEAFSPLYAGHDADDDRVERATLLPLLARLGLERVDAPAGAADGEVWVRTDPRLDDEFANW